LQKIWWDEGSPLVVISRRMHEKLKKLVDVPVSLAMRYGNLPTVSGFKNYMIRRD
jgi:ferrochelatase